MLLSKPSPIQVLRNRKEWYMSEMPDSIRIPALEGVRFDEVVRPIEEATIDDLTFAAIGIQAELRQIQRKLTCIQELHDLARKQGALGCQTVQEVFIESKSREVYK